jgi:hypothetical protein
VVSVELRELISKLDQIEEHARLTLYDFPADLAKERQRMIISLVRFIRTEFELAGHRPSVAAIREPGGKTERSTGS